jgi:hypothetical protein
MIKIAQLPVFNAGRVLTWQRHWAANAKWRGKGEMGDIPP